MEKKYKETGTVILLIILIITAGVLFAFVLRTYSAQENDSPESFDPVIITESGDASLPDGSVGSSALQEEGDFMAESEYTESPEEIQTSILYAEELSAAETVKMCLEELDNNETCISNVKIRKEKRPDLPPEKKTDGSPGSKENRPPGRRKGASPEYQMEGLEEEEMELQYFELTILGDHSLSESTANILQKELLSIYQSGYSVGFLMMDIYTGGGVCYNSDSEYYSASSIKAPFVTSLCRAVTDAIEEEKEDLTEITIRSDNDSYQYLQEKYGEQYLEAFAASVGVSLALTEGGYTWYTAEDLARLWLGSYSWFETGNEGERVGTWFESPEESAIFPILGSSSITRTKAGWIADDEEYCASTDAGIVYSESGPYILVILSDYPAELENLYGLVEALNEVHNELS